MENILLKSDKQSDVALRQHLIIMPLSFEPSKLDTNSWDVYLSEHALIKHTQEYLVLAYVMKSNCCE